MVPDFSDRPEPYTAVKSRDESASRVAIVIGTRPELIKLAPVVQAFRSRGDCPIRVDTIFTGQHDSLVDEIAEYLEVRPDHRLLTERNGLDLAGLTSSLVERSHDLFACIRPDVVMVQGDTTSAFACALSAFYLNIDVAHVEAGLRTGDLNNPFPEEANRAMIARLAAINYAPTETACNSLLKEGIDRKRIVVTGNTVIDAVQNVARRLESHPWPGEHIDLNQRKRMILVTMHRRESWEHGIADICRALADVAAREPDAQFVLPIHPNKVVFNRISELLGNVDGITLVPALAYPQFVSLLKQCRFVVSDSGGVQEEAAALGKPVLVLRQKTERMEGVNLGIAKLIGTDRLRVGAEISLLLNDDAAYGRMCSGDNPYGDGAAAQRITDSLVAFLDSGDPTLPYGSEFISHRPPRIAAVSE